jgi:MFS family permease
MAGMAALTSVFVMRRLGYRKPMIAGFVISASGLLLLAIPPHGLSPFVWLSIACGLSGIGVGMAGPPSNNANIQLLPTHVAAIVGLRAMFRSIGGILAISIASAVIASSASGARVLPKVFLVLAVLTVTVTPTILGVPENTRSRRLDRSLGISD